MRLLPELLLATLNMISEDTPEIRASLLIVTLLRHDHASSVSSNQEIIILYEYSQKWKVL